MGRDIFEIVCIWISSCFLTIVFIYLIFSKGEASKNKETKQIMTDHIMVMFNHDEISRLHLSHKALIKDGKVMGVTAWSIQPPKEGMSTGPKDSWGNHTFYYYGRQGRFPYCTGVSAGPDGVFHTDDDVLVMPYKKEPGL